MENRKGGAVKYIFVTGGVASSLGKGIISASLARLLQARGYSVTIQKFDPYINVDPGTLNPLEHGETYITEDGTVADLDLGHYERFTAVKTTSMNTVTSGSIYLSVIQREREGGYLGKTVQVIPHITDEIKLRIQLLGQTGKYDVIITEIGGTVGDIESLPHIESVRQLRNELGHSNTAIVHLTLIPYMSASGELKTKPTQNSVKQMLENGLQPDILVLRTEKRLTEEVKRKVALFCNVDQNAVIESIDVPTIYEVPLRMQAQKLDEVVLQKLGLQTEGEPDMEEWRRFVNRIKNPRHRVDIALVGKYTALPDAYKSISESFVHSGAANDTKVKLHFISAEAVTGESAKQLLGQVCGILLGPGFAPRGFEGKIEAAGFARKNGIPFLGIGLGMQCAVIEYARNVLGLRDASSTEMEQSPNPVIHFADETKTADEAMRLGAFDCRLEHNSKVYEAYGRDLISERHNHRYEFNNAYLDRFADAGMKPVGFDVGHGLVEAVELEGHPWFVGVQFHPEYNSTALNPHPLFTAFVKASLEHCKERAHG